MTVGGVAPVAGGAESFEEALELEGGGALAGFEIAYESYGVLNREGDNAVLICHALTSDQHAAGCRPGEERPGWWDVAIGPGKPLDTDRFFVVCSNVLGGAGGSTGPGSLDPATGRPFAMRFPVVTVGDMVEAQARLVERLGIQRLHAVIGGCLGGFQVFEWLARFPSRVARAVAISASPRVSAHTIALWSVFRDVVRLDPDWRGGDYYDHGQPRRAVGLLSRLGALFWMRREVLEQRFGVKTVSNGPLSHSFERDFEVEEFFERLDSNAPNRFDVNSFLYLTRAMDYFDLTRGELGLDELFGSVTSSSLLISYRSDWRYPPEGMEEVRRSLEAAGAPVEHRILDSEFGHGAFIHDFEGTGTLLADFLA